MLRSIISNHGTLLGVILDLSGSMSESIRNDVGDQSTRVESFTRTVQKVLEDAELFLKNAPAKEDAQLRLFVHGFGFQLQGIPTVSSSLGDIFSILSGVNEQMESYRLLQPEIEGIWLGELEQVLEEKKIRGDAKEELHLFVERELREQAIEAEKQRSKAKFKHWCELTCQRLTAYDTKVRSHIQQYTGFAKLFLPFVIGFLWLLRGPMLVLTYLNSRFEAMLQRKLEDFRDNANKYATQQAEKVVTVTNKAINKHAQEISAAIEQYITDFIDREAFKFIQLHKAKMTANQRKNAFDSQALKSVYADTSKRISDIMSPHANLAWKTSVFLLQQGAKALKIKPNWNLLQEKTIRCAQQVVWEKITPIVRAQARKIAIERFTRAVLITIIQETKNTQTTLSPQEAFNLIKFQEETNISMRELPIFGESPLGFALNQTFIRLWQESQLPQNQGLRPAILIISDGMPTDTNIVDAPSLAEKVKRAGIPIVCCLITNCDVGHPWILRQKPGWSWPEAAHFMFSIASSIDEWPEFGKRLMASRFTIKKQAKLFVQINHTAYLKNFIEAILLPVEREQ